MKPTEPTYAYNEELMISGIQSFLRERRAALAALKRAAAAQDELDLTPSERRALFLERRARLADQLADLRTFGTELREQINCTRIAEERTEHRMALEALSVLQVVSAQTLVDRSDILAANRVPRVTRARYQAMAALRLCGFSLSRIGLLGMHHTSVLRGIRRVNDLLQTNAAFAGDYAAIHAALQLVVDAARKGPQSVQHGAEERQAA